MEKTDIMSDLIELADKVSNQSRRGLDEDSQYRLRLGEKIGSSVIGPVRGTVFDLFD